MRSNRVTEPRTAAGANQVHTTAAVAMAVLLLAATAAPAAAEWAVRKEETVRRTFTLAPGGASGAGGGPGAAGEAGRPAVEVDDFTGYVRVHAHAGGEVAVTVHEIWSADSEAKIEQARREVRLDIGESGGRLRLYVNGPFRDRDGGTSFHGWRGLGYEAVFDFDLEVPAGVDLVARTVNGGEVLVNGVGGRFDVSNVNGAVTLERMGGAGKARTVNGAVVASFSRNPTGPCAFDTVNGRVEVTFLDGLAADLRFKTLNGNVYTDYDYTYRNLPPEPADRSRGHFHYRSHGEFAARIAGGGPELAFSTINGNIFVRRQGA